MASLPFQVVWGFFYPHYDAPVQEYQFHPTRKWRFDYAFPPYKVAVEIEGGVWIRGRHTRGKGYTEDIKKYNAAVVLGWRVIRMTPEMWDSDPIAVVDQIKKVLDSIDIE